MAYTQIGLKISCNLSACGFESHLSAYEYYIRQDVGTLCARFPSARLEVGTDTNSCTEIRESVRILLAAEEALKRRAEPKTDASTVEHQQNNPWKHKLGRTRTPIKASMLVITNELHPMSAELRLQNEVKNNCRGSTQRTNGSVGNVAVQALVRAGSGAKLPARGACKRVLCACCKLKTRISSLVKNTPDGIDPFPVLRFH